MPHTDYTTVTDRIAARIAKAALTRTSAADVPINANGMLGANGVLAIIVRIASQASKQGLEPADLDRTEGLDVLCAIAIVVRPTMVPWHQLRTALPADWQHVVNAAARQLARTFQQVQR